MRRFDVIVVGGGHAGVEASMAASKMGCKTLLLTMNVDTIGVMSCNPAIGGMAKSHLVKEIDALGGQMALVADETAIQYRTLNAKKGYAVRATRCQVDRAQYRDVMKRLVMNQDRLSVRQGTVKALIFEQTGGSESRQGKILGLSTAAGEEFYASTVIITAGTFLNGKVHVGLRNFAGGRFGESPSSGLAEQLLEFGFEVGRLKTGTVPRLDAKTIDYSGLEFQGGETRCRPFSYWNRRITPDQIGCHITYTNPETHELISKNLDRSPIFQRIISSCGPRYCPSIEDKVHRFAGRARHQVFLEPEGRTTKEVYAGGLSTSLPVDVQEAYLRTIRGLENVEIIRPGYGIEYDFFNPRQIHPTLETKQIAGLFFAGQINGTSGYEEAAAQGLMAGINAASKVQDRPPLLLSRAESYIGVLIDDLTSKGTLEPYRMFTSRAEHRLLLREDNADLRLSEKGYALGLISDEQIHQIREKQKGIQIALGVLNEIRVRPDRRTTQVLANIGLQAPSKDLSLKELVRRPGVHLGEVDYFYVHDVRLAELVSRYQINIEAEIKYEGYIDHQLQEIKKLRRLDPILIPEAFEFARVPGLGNEAIEKLTLHLPRNLGEASRISGITPSAITILRVYLESHRGRSGTDPKLPTEQLALPRQMQVQ